MLNVRELRLPDELERIMTLYGETRPHPGSRKRFEWAYIENPAGQARVWGAEDGERLAAMAAVFPRRVRLACGRDIVGWTTGDLSVAPPYRRMGLASALREETRKAIDRGEAALLVALPNPAAARVHARAGFAPLGHMERMVRPVALPGMLATRRLSGALINCLLRPSQGLPLTTTLLRHPAPIVALEAIEALYQRVSSVLGTSLVRSAEYLEWRYLRDPRADVQLMLAYDDDRLRGFLALTIRQRSMFVRDWLADDDGVLRGMIAAATRLCIDAGYCWLSMSALTGHRDVGVLRSAGFRHRGTGTAVTAYARPGAGWAHEVLTPTAWYLTGGDPDI